LGTYPKIDIYIKNKLFLCKTEIYNRIGVFVFQCVLSSKNDMERLITLFFAMAITIATFAQTNGYQIKSAKKDLDIATKKNQTAKLKYDYSKLLFASKSPLKHVHYDWSNNNWGFSYDSDINYHADGRKNSENIKDLSGKEFSRINYNYDNQNRLLEIISEMKSNSGWVPYYSTIIEYNTQGDMVKYEDRIWMNKEWTILNGLAYGITYDILNSSKSTIESYFNGSKYDTSMMYVEFKNNNVITSEETYQYVGNNTFIALEKYNYLFENNVDTGLLKFSWDGTTWVEDLLYCNYEWSSPSKDFLTKNNIYIKLGNDWDLFQQELFTQENYGGFSYLLQDFRSGMWFDNMHIQTLNDSLGNRTFYIYDLYLGGNWQELFRIEEEFNYDAEGNILEHVYKETDSNGDLTPITKDVYSNFILLTGINNSKVNSIGLYPNPTTNYVILKDEKFQYKKYSLMDLNGKTVENGYVPSSLRLEFDELTSGLYILRIEEHQTKISIHKN